MLRSLQIRDFAIIETVELEFGGGLTVLTGETGAGKSILVDALELIAGNRAGADVVRAGAERADVTAGFDIADAAGELRTLLDEQSITVEGELLLRRVVGNDGRSRAWLNGQSVPVQLLRDVAAHLIDIHGQHEFQSLMRPAAQRQLVDSYDQLESLATQVRAAHSVWLTLLNRSLEVESAASDRHARLDLLRYQVQELEALQLRAGEVAELNTERARIAHHARLVEAAQTALDALYESEQGNAHAQLARSLGALRTAAGVDARLESLQPLLEEAVIRVKDAAHSLRQYLDSLELDPQRRDAVEKRLAALEELARKHRVSSEELPARHVVLRDELASIEGSATDLATLRQQLGTALATYQDLARQLSARRADAARRLAKEVSARMQVLGMAGGRLLIDVTPLDSAEPASHGADRIEFRVSTNPGQPARAVAKVASGGELARLSLAIQVSCARDSAPCMVFDEVDAGIGGAVAEIVGRELRKLGGGAQVLCVTHLPQVAAQGHQHLRVSKLTDGRATRTAVTVLGGDARVEELSRMLGGIEITARARAHAIEMLAGAANLPAATAAPAARRQPPSRR
jgi:DNA repair protein RecN (Recombination protein N)